MILLAIDTTHRVHAAPGKGVAGGHAVHGFCVSPRCSSGSIALATPPVGLGLAGYYFGSPPLPDSALAPPGIRAQAATN